MLPHVVGPRLGDLAAGSAAPLGYSLQARRRHGQTRREHFRRAEIAGHCLLRRDVA
jgi:hypothetical protein